MKKFMVLALVVAVVASPILGAIPSQAAGSPPALGKIAFISERDGNREIYVMNADGSGQTNLTNNPAFDDAPNWSPDGTKIVFRFNPGFGPDKIWIMNTDGSNRHELYFPQVGGQPAWSPDGTKIAIIKRRIPGLTDDLEIAVVNADGSGLLFLTDNSVADMRPAWSPDGTKIAFFRGDAVALKGDVWVMNADGTDQLNLTNMPSVGNLWPTWSPDGTKIAFASDRDHPFPGLNEIYVMNADGSNVTRLTYTGLNSWPAWSPDGTRIAYQSNPDPFPVQGEIFVMNADGTNPIRLTNNMALDSYPAWAPLVRVTIDIKPGSYPNSINLNSRGVIPVAVLTTPEFDVNAIVPDTVWFAGAAPLRWTMEDVNGDGHLDMLFHFQTQDLDLSSASTTASLTGAIGSGFQIMGEDTVNIVP